MALHTSISSFNAALVKYGTHEVPDFQRGKATVIAMEAGRNLTLLTPVDTGRAKGNWQFTVGNPAVGDTERLDPVPEGNPGSVYAIDVLTQIKKWKPGQTLWWHNGLDYISALNDGTEGREAHMMLERTKEHLTRWLKYE